jgi:hypothetical protein
MPLVMSVKEQPGGIHKNPGPNGKDPLTTFSHHKVFAIQMKSVLKAKPTAGRLKKLE